MAGIFTSSLSGYWRGKLSITASILYNLIECPHRIALDAFGDQAQRDAVSPFVRMLWERGNIYERELIAGLKVAPQTEFLDLSAFEGEELEKKTLEAMANKAPLIYQGKIMADDLVGRPDLLRWEAGGYVPGDVKSGRGESEGDDVEGGKPKDTYAVQLGLYIDILERLGLSAGRRGFIWDINGEEVVYRYEEPQGKRDPYTLWELYQETLDRARNILSRKEETQGALAAKCKLCHWHTVCKKELETQDDLTLIPYLGRAARSSLIGSIKTVRDMADCDPQDFFQKDKTIFKGVGQKSLNKFAARARLLKAIPAQAYLTDIVSLPVADKEIFFDIEDDPLRGICYLHGIVERTGGDSASERFIGFFAAEPTPTGEREAFAQAMEYFRANPSAIIYYYSKYERTAYRKLQRKYPDVCEADEVEALFHPDRAVDLYNDVVLKKTEWPTYSYSIKALAVYLDFEWRDNNPSGAASIEWYDQWLKTGDITVKQRILDYNEDDCRATRVLLDGIRNLS